MNTTPQNIFTSPKNKPRNTEYILAAVKHHPSRSPPHYHLKNHDNPDDNNVTIWVVITPSKSQGVTCPPDARPPSHNACRWVRGVERREGRKKDSGCEVRDYE